MLPYSIADAERDLLAPLDRAPKGAVTSPAPTAGPNGSRSSRRTRRSDKLLVVDGSNYLRQE